MSDFVHGTVVEIVDEGSKPIELAKSSVIGIVGSAGKGPVNVPTGLSGNLKLAANTFGSYKGDGFTGIEAQKAVLSQVGASIVFINVCDPDTHNTDISAESLTFNAGGLASTLKRFISAITIDETITVKKKFTIDTITLPSGISSITSVKSSDGVTTYDITDDYTVASNVITRVAEGDITSGQEVLIEYESGALASGTDYSVDVDEGVFTRIASGKIADKATILVDYTYVDPTKVDEADILGDEGLGTGIYGLLGASAATGLKPKVLIAPGWTHQTDDDATRNAVVAALEPIACKLGAIVLKDGHNTTHEQALADKANESSKRVYFIDPWAKMKDGNGNTQNVPFSAVAAGLIAATDKKFGGPWVSPSNKVAKGIVGVGRTVEFGMDDASTKSNILNDNDIATVINEQGFRLWGNTMTDGSFINAVRVEDLIRESILEAFLWAIDRNITTNLVSEIVERVKNFLREIEGKGGILGGDVWVDSEINTPDSLAQGKLYVDFKVSLPVPLQTLTFRMHLTNEYISRVLG